MYDPRVHSHNIPQKFNANRNDKKNLQRIVSSKRRTLHNWWRTRATGFLHSKETTEQK